MRNDTILSRMIPGEFALWHDKFMNPHLSYEFNGPEEVANNENFYRSASFKIAAELLIDFLNEEQISNYIHRCYGGFENKQRGHLVTATNNKKHSDHCWITNIYLNVTPMTRELNCKSLNALESFVKELIRQGDDKVHIWTGRLYSNFTILLFF